MSLFLPPDYYAAEAVMYLKDHGIKVPEDISVAGFDDSEYARMQAGQRYIRIWHWKGAAVMKLFDIIEGKKRSD